MLGFLSTLFTYWKKFGEFLGDSVGRLVMMLLYVTIIVPFALIMRLTSDPLNLRAQPPQWIERPEENITIEAALEQSISSVN